MHGGPYPFITKTGHAVLVCLLLYRYTKSRRPKTDGEYQNEATVSSRYLTLDIYVHHIMHMNLFYILETGGVPHDQQTAHGISCGNKVQFSEELVFICASFFFKCTFLKQPLHVVSP